MNKIKEVYKKTPSWLKILLLNGGISYLTFFSGDIEDGTFNKVDYIKIGIATLLNILIHLKLREEKPDGRNN